MLQLRCSGIYCRRNRTETRKRGKSHQNRSYLRPTSEHHPKGSSPYEGNHRPGTVISRRKQLSHLHHGGISPRRHLPTEASPHGGIFSEGLSPGTSSFRALSLPSRDGLLAPAYDRGISPRRHLHMEERLTRAQAQAPSLRRKTSP